MWGRRAGDCAAAGGGHAVAAAMTPAPTVKSHREDVTGNLLLETTSWLQGASSGKPPWFAAGVTGQFERFISFNSRAALGPCRRGSVAILGPASRGLRSVCGYGAFRVPEGRGGVPARG